MEAFSLLKYWGRGGGGGAAGGTAATVNASATCQAGVCSEQKNTTTTTIAASALRAGSDEDGSMDGEDEGPFFDLEFAVPEEEESGGSRGSVGNDDGVDEEEGEEVTEEPGVSLSPSDDVFFKGRLVPLESSSLVFHGGDQNGKNQFLAGSLRKSAAKFRVFTMKGLKKPKSAVTVAAPSPSPSPKHHQQSKFFAVKFKVEEVPIVSLFTRDNGSWSSGRGPKQSMDETAGAAGGGRSKEMVNRYLNKIKPLYVKVSGKSNGEKSRFAAHHVGAASVDATPAEAQKQTHLPSHVKDGLRVVRKHLGKSRSASSAVAAVPSPPAASVARRRDDSLLQQEDGIQSAIAHCKRSFNATREPVDSPLPRSKSDSYDERSAVNTHHLQDGL